MSSVPRTAVVLAGSALTAVVLVACGGDDDTETPPTATASAAGAAQATATAEPPTIAATLTVEERAEAEALLKAAALRAEDLPEGFTLDEEKFTSNEEAAEEESDYPGGATEEDLDSLGRILGYEASYTRESLGALLGGTTNVGVGTSVYRESDGASQHLDLMREQWSDPGFVKALQQQAGGGVGEVSDVEISPMSVAEAGDEQFGLELRLTIHQADLDWDMDIIAQFVHMQRGRLLGYVSLAAIGAPSRLGPSIEELARVLDERMKDALE